MVDWKKWELNTAPTIFKKLGVRKGDRILDFGANEGDYTIPLAILVGVNGNIIAMDEDKRSLRKIKKRAKSHSLSNIKYLHFHWDKGEKIPLNTGSLDSALLFDILHYFEDDKRRVIYNEVKRLLCSEGLLVSFPQHNKESYALWNLADLSVKDIIAEIEAEGFQLIQRTEEKIIHDHDWYPGEILTFQILD